MLYPAKSQQSLEARMSYFRTQTGRKVYFKDIAQAIDTLHPRLRGKHIFDQLDAVGLYGEFRRGTTPCGLPYSFSEYLEERELLAT